MVLGLWDQGVITGGTFTTKEVSKRRHVYFQFRKLGQKTRRVYVGPDTPETWATVEAFKARGLDHASFRIVKGFADAGLFSAGQGLAMLIGTLAFNVLGNVLGVSWKSNMRTQDISFGSEHHQR